MKITRRTKKLLGLRITFQVIVVAAMISQMANATTYQQLPFNFIYNKKSCDALKATIEKADPNSNVTTGGFKFQDKSYGSLWYDSIGEYNTHCTNITGSLTP